MMIYSVYDAEFAPYGRVIPDLDTAELLSTLKEVSPAPEDAVIYIPSDASLEALPIFRQFRDGVYGGMPVQIGYCNGTNHTMNALEYHRGCEINVATTDIILLLALQSDMDENFMLDSSCVKAFKVPAGVSVIVYETALHYAPVGDGFRCIVVLPRDTNTNLPEPTERPCREDLLLYARNKWLIAHPASPEANNGAFVGITGENLKA